jgi:VCBS repeat-containing protein
VLAGFFAFGFVSLLIGNSERTAREPVPDHPVATIKPAGKVVDSKGDPVANAKVSIDPGGIPSFVVSTSDGGFQFSGFHQSADVQQLTVSHQDFANFVMNLRPDDVGTFQRIQLRSKGKGAKAIAANKTVIMSGRVLDENGQPIANAEVIVEAGGDPPQHLTAYTRSDGAYSIGGFQPRANRLQEPVMARRGGAATASSRRPLPSNSALSPSRLST